MVATPAYPVPHFFIVGAPKCGTTALYTYLLAHPAVFLPRDPKSPDAYIGLNYKEPHFFASDLHWRGYTHDPAVYARLYAEAPAGALLGDASVHYLYSREAIANIRQHRPEAKIIAMLRHPVDLIYSLHGQHRYSLAEPEPDFVRALALEDTRPFPLIYRPVARLGEQLERLYQHFPREQVHLIWHEDFKRDTAGEVQRACQFLGIGPCPLERFTPENPQKHLHSRALQRLLLWRPRGLQRLVRRVLPADLRHRVAMGIIGLNQVARPRPKMDAALRRQLIAEYADDIRLLARLTGRDLDHWMEP